MYLFILEDGTVMQGETLTDGDMVAFRKGVLDIITLDSEGNFITPSTTSDKWETVEYV